ncbi:hypothetical protein HYE68_008932 [Fusarium pseudograminearum]|nr:hypothetical protein HYE68_008932 [Fusarium pseudograminearum]
MRFVSFATVLGAALLPAVNARPACRPDTSTKTTASATSAATTTAIAVETSSTKAATTVQASTTYETTTASETTIVVSATDETTTALETTIAISETASSDSTALIPTTTAETTPAEIVTTTAETTPADIATTTAETTAAEIVTTTTEAATTTTTAAAGPTNFVENGSFEDNTSNAWDIQNSDIANNPANAHTGGQYLEFSINNDFASGQDQASQTISGLSTDRQYGFSFYSTVFSSPTPIHNPSTICLIQVQQGTTQISLFRVDFNNLDSYQPFSVNFTPVSSVISLSLKLRCTNGQRVTLALGIDDVVIGDVI